jgi:hypothetical protein
MDEVQAEADRLEAAGLTLDVEGDVVCCYARQDKHWVTGPDGQRWENYVVLADAHPELEGRSLLDLTEPVPSGGCCASAETGTTTAQPGSELQQAAAGCC